jgi:hypothetical protein
VNRTADFSCPKCGKAAGPAATACARCGLVFALWRPEAAPSTASLDTQGEALWDEVVASWQDSKRHEAFVKHCAANGLLAPAGRRYRGRLDVAPDDEIARRMQERIVGMVTVQLGVARATPAAPVTRSRWFWVVLLLFAVAGLVAGLLYGRSGSAGASGPSGRGPEGAVGVLGEVGDGGFACEGGEGASPVGRGSPVVGLGERAPARGLSGRV